MLLEEVKCGYLDNTQKAAVLAHEVVYELLHYKGEGSSRLTKEIMELEAEAVALLL